jgi:hypothetical protein
MRAALALFLVALAAASSAGAARADGDPASDYLITQRVFLPYDAKFPPKQTAALTGLVAATNRAGFRIRVAIIWSDYDLGSVTSLWRKPKTYARFLGMELSFVYKQRLLIVMPNGFGFNWPKHSPAGAYRLLAAIRIPPGPGGLVTAATAAVTRLSAAAGVHATPAPAARTARHGGDGRTIVLAVVLGVLALSGGALFFVRRRAAR